MISHDPHDQELETLSALFDGALQGDGARFALRRLAHDAAWRQTAGRWQLAGDVLRGQPIAASPASFADRVAAAVAAETRLVAVGASVALPAKAATTSHAARRRWLGGAALAASVAMVAMFVARPFMASTTAPDAPVTASQVATSVPAPASPSAVGQAVATTTKPSQPTDPAAQLATAAIAVAQVPRRIGERRSRGQSQRAALRVASRQPMIAASVTRPALARMESPAIAPTTSTAAVSSAVINPFRAPHVEPVSRPWPRAVLPSSPATGAFTASYGSSATSPSFYPFEPQLPATAEAASGARADN